MLFSVQPEASVPIYEQIVAQVIYGVAQAHFRGHVHPKRSRVAEKLVVHPNTVARAFQELERMGVVASRRGPPAWK